MFLHAVGAMTLVINMFIAPCFGEKLEIRDVLCTLVIFAGTIISLIFGSKENRIYTVKQLLKLYLEWPFILYICFFILFLIAAALFIRQVKKRRSLGIPWRHDLQVESVLWPSLAGTFGAHSVLFAKSCTEIVKSVQNGEWRASSL